MFTYHFSSKRNKSYKLTHTLENRLATRKGWIKSSDAKVDLSEDSNKSRMNQYLDGTEHLWIKHLYARAKTEYNPKTYVLVNPDDLRDIMDENTAWFLKLSTEVSGSGKDIGLVTTFDEAVKLMSTHLGKKWVLQRAILDPIRFDGRKADFRYFAVLAFDFRPEDGPYFWLLGYNKLLIRLAMNRYDPLSNDPYVQLTNSDFAEREFRAHRIDAAKLASQTILLAKKDDKDGFFDRIEEIVCDVVRSNAKKFHAEPNSFGFIHLGFDILFAENGEVYLLEVNRRPTFYEDGDKMKRLLHKDLEDDYVGSLLGVVIEPLLRNEEAKGSRNFTLLWDNSEL